MMIVAKYQFHSGINRPETVGYSSMDMPNGVTAEIHYSIGASTCVILSPNDHR